MQITAELIRHIEALARLDLSETERDSLRADLARILDYVAQIEELDTADVEPTTHALPTESRLREDEARPSLPRAEGLASAPRAGGGAFLVPPVISGDEEPEHA